MTLSGSEAARVVAADAAWFPHRLDLQSQTMSFVRLDEAALRAASFLDGRLAVSGRDVLELPLDRLPSLPCCPDFIFHIGHCGSTLLSRLLDLSPGVLGLREPQLLRDLAASAPTTIAIQSADGWAAVFARSLGLFSRPHQPGQRIVVKATSTCNDLIAPVLALHAEARVVLLYMPLERYLATMLKPPHHGRDAMQAAPDRLRYLQARLGDDRLHQVPMTVAETIALGWIAELARYEEIRSVAGERARVVPLDFEDLLGDLPGQLARLQNRLGLQGADPAAVDAVMRAYSKQPEHAYSPADRLHDLQLARRMFGAEIARGIEWAENLIARHALLAPLGASLH